MHPFRNVLYAVVLSLAVASFADAQRTALPPTVSDSAGIRLVVNATPTSIAATIAASPMVEIGGGGDPAADLSLVAAAVRLGDGRIAIAEQSTRSIKIFDARGRFVRAIGRQGQGPGEFAAITRLQLLRGDSIVAYDAVRGTLAVFDTTGRLGRTNRVVSGMGGLQLVGLLGNGTMVMTRSYNPNFGSASKLERDAITYVTTSPGSTTIDTIMTVPGTEIFLYAGTDFSSRNPLPFGRTSFAAVQDDRIIVASGDAWQVEVRSPAGALREIHRVRHQPIAVTRSDIAQYRKDLIERLRGVRMTATGGSAADMPGRIAQQERMLDLVPYPDTHAPYDSLIVGAEGEVWVRSAGIPAGRPRNWVVLSRTGAALGTVSVPARTRLLQVGREFVVAVRKDEEDVEHVGLYALRRVGARGENQGQGSP